MDKTTTTLYCLLIEPSMIHTMFTIDNNNNGNNLLKTPFFWIIDGLPGISVSPVPPFRTFFLRSSGVHGPRDAPEVHWMSECHWTSTRVTTVTCPVLSFTPNRCKSSSGCLDTGPSFQTLEVNKEPESYEPQETGPATAVDDPYVTITHPRKKVITLAHGQVYTNT